MEKVELLFGVLLVKEPVPFHSCNPIRALLNNSQMFQVTLMIRGRMSIERVNNQPFVRMSCAYLRPIHIESSFYCCKTDNRRRLRGQPTVLLFP